MHAQVVSLDKLPGFIGQRRVSDEWFEITQDRINQFADCTLDHQYIHIDPVRAAESQFGSTVAHGLLTLSLLPRLLAPIQLVPENTLMGINYGFNRVRLPSPVPVNSHIRAVATLLNVSDSGPDRVTLTSEIIVEIRGQEKPALAAESLAMFVIGKPDETEP